MKNLFFTVAFGFVALFATANNNETTPDSLENTIDSIELETDNNLIEGEGEVLFKLYNGRCLDGHRFSFNADNAEDAQAYVQAYCRGRDEAPIEPSQPPVTIIASE